MGSPASGKTQKALALAAIAAAYRRDGSPGAPKGARLRGAIARLVAAGALADGARLPGERDLCAALDISLGTVQKALDLLVRDGDLVREHGRGTFVRRHRQEMQALWHYRFVDPATGERLPVYARLLDRALVPTDAETARYLGADPRGFVRIRRLIDIGGQFTCWSEMDLPASRFRRLMSLKASRLERVNLKQILSEDFGASTISIGQTARLVRPPATVAAQLGLKARVHCLRLQIVAFDRAGDPISLQKILVPPNACDLELSETAQLRKEALAA